MRRLSCLCILFLVGCASAYHQEESTRHTSKTAGKYQKAAQDSAPSGPVPTHFKRVVPKNEPLSRYGNPDSYQVDGKTYEVMTSAHGYHARGLASWYGTKFHDRRTSSGEMYDMYALTAAHKTLPLPSYIRVKNLNNGKMAIIKVNDRGPFHSKRILDLSYAAAVKLGLYPHGTALVEIEAVSIKGVQAHRAQYYLQTGAFTQMQSARQWRVKVSGILHTTVKVEHIPGKYVVSAGPFANKQSVYRARQSLINHGIKSPIVMLH